MNNKEMMELTKETAMEWLKVSKQLLDCALFWILTFLAFVLKSIGRFAKWAFKKAKYGIFYIRCFWRLYSPFIGYWIQDRRKDFRNMWYSIRKLLRSVWRKITDVTKRTCKTCIEYIEVARYNFKAAMEFRNEVIKMPDDNVILLPLLKMPEEKIITDPRYLIECKA